MNNVSVLVRAVAAEVYRQGCTVTYRGTAELVQGENRLTVEGLPDGLDEASISLRLPPVVSQGQVKVLRDDDQDPYEEPSELDLRYFDLARRIENKELELGAWKGMVGKVGGNTAIEFLGLYPAKLDELTSELSTLREEERHLERQRDEEHERVARPRLEIDVSSSQAGEMPLELTCRSDPAGWEPSYDVLVDDLSSPLKLRLKGAVWQHTGDDWQEVTLRLGTGTASVLGDLPRFVPRYLRKAETHAAPAPRPKVSTYAARSMRLDRGASLPYAAAAPMETADAYGFDSLMESAAPEAEVIEQATATTYELDGLQTLASDSEDQLFPISTSELAATYHLYSFPRRSEEAFLVAHLDAEPAPEVLERPLSVYIEGSYAGSISIGRATDEHGYELPLGSDKRIRVRHREDVKRSTKLFGGKVLVEHACAISMESHARAPMTVVVLERVPVSRDKEIEVTLLEGSGAAFDEERGELRWERTLTPGERLELRATYVIAHPKGQSISESAR